jgi:hypothetical protein
MASTFGVRPLRPLPPLPLPPPLPPTRPIPPASLPLPLPRLLLPASLPLPLASPSLPPTSPPPPIDAEADEESDGVHPPSYSPRPSLSITSPSSTSAFVEHEYHLNNNKHVPWAMLKVRCAPCLAHQIDTLTWTCAARVRASPHIARTSLRATASGARSSSTFTSPITSAPSRSRSALHSPRAHPSHICADHRHALLGHR